nr:RluA family pseudouridine synthase [Ardenticatena sp.]
MSRITWQVPPSARGERLDRWLAGQLPDLSRAAVQKLIAEGHVQVNGTIATKGGLKLRGTEYVSAMLPKAPPDPLQPEPLPLDILYEDGDVVVINKPPGLVVHPAPGHEGGTLVNALLARYPDLAQRDQSERPGIVHRLDRDTSGVLIVARHAEARRFLQRQFSRREAEKFYLAAVHGRPSSDHGLIDAPLGRDPRNRKKFAVVPGGRPALTEFTVRELFPAYTLLKVRLVTGRTHQIRVHLASIGTPIVNDTVYGRRRPEPGLPTQRQFLHAWRLRVQLPSGEYRTFEAPLAPDLEETLAFWRQQVDVRR